MHLTTLFTGQPKLMSRMSKPRSSQTRAAVGHHLGIGAEQLGGNRMLFRIERQIALQGAVRFLRSVGARSDALTPCELVNSVIIRPHPPRLRMKRRKTVSVTPAMGASTVAGAMVTLPICESLRETHIFQFSVDRCSIEMRTL